jgi:hypothetical protein
MDKERGIGGSNGNIAAKVDETTGLLVGSVVFTDGGDGPGAGGSFSYSCTFSAAASN